VFDDPNRVWHGGLVPVMALAKRAGLPELLAKYVRPGGGCGVNAPLKVGCLVAGMAAGADSVNRQRRSVIACRRLGSAYGNSSRSVAPRQFGFAAARLAAAASRAS
jgi:hypothetical protein